MPRNRRRQTYPLQITASGGNRIQTVPSRAAFTPDTRTPSVFRDAPRARPGTVTLPAREQNPPVAARHKPFRQYRQSHRVNAFRCFICTAFGQRLNPACARRTPALAAVRAPVKTIALSFCNRFKSRRAMRARSPLPPPQAAGPAMPATHKEPS